MVSGSHRRGVSRVEVLVLTCIGVLGLGMLGPVLQQVRAGGRGAACQNNLRQMAIAAQNYESIYTHLPTGMDRQYVGTLIHILEFMDGGSPLYRNFSFDPAYSLYWDNPHNRPPTDGTDEVPRPPRVYGCEWEFPSYLCPEGPQPRDTVTALLAVHYGIPQVDYRPNNELGDGHLYTGSPGRLVMGRSHYLGVGGDWRRQPPYNGRYRGIFGYNTRTQLSRIEDGTSNTVMFAETWGGYVDWQGGGGVPSGWTVASRSAGFNYSTFGTCPNPDNPNCDYKYSLGLHVGAFGGLHGSKYDRFYVAFADGSVRLMPGNLDFNLWMAMCGMADGEIFPKGLEPEGAWALGEY